MCSAKPSKPTICFQYIKDKHSWSFFIFYVITLWIYPKVHHWNRFGSWYCMRHRHYGVYVLLPTEESDWVQTVCAPQIWVFSSYSDCIICAARTLWLICWLHIWSELVCLQRASLESVISFEDMCLLTTQTLYRRLLGHGKALACCCIGSIIQLIHETLIDLWTIVHCNPRFYDRSTFLLYGMQM